jgi:hypothetical protein
MYVITYLLKIILISPTVGANSKRSNGRIQTMVCKEYGLGPMNLMAYQSSWNRSSLTVG